MLLISLCRKPNTFLVMFSDDFHFYFISFHFTSLNFILFYLNMFIEYHPCVQHSSKDRNYCYEQADKVLLSLSLPSISSKRWTGDKSVKEQWWTYCKVLWNSMTSSNTTLRSEKASLSLLWNLSGKRQPSADLGERVLVIKNKQKHSKCQGPKAWMSLA